MNKHYTKILNFLETLPAPKRQLLATYLPLLLKEKNIIFFQIENLETDDVTTISLDTVEEER